MTSITSASTAVKSAISAVALATAWKRAGWKPGCPPALRETFAIDQRCYRHFACTACKSRQTEVWPFHRRGGYALILACKKCGRGEGA
jgi:hypothetical protein